MSSTPQKSSLISDDSLVLNLEQAVILGGVLCGIKTKSQKCVFKLDLILD